MSELSDKTKAAAVAWVEARAAEATANSECERAEQARRAAHTATKKAADLLGWSLPDETLQGGQTRFLRAGGNTLQIYRTNAGNGEVRHSVELLRVAE